MYVLVSTNTDFRAAKEFHQGQVHRLVANMAHYIALPFYVKSDKNNCDNGLTIAQAVTRRLPTATARVRFRVSLCGICGGESDTEAGFLQILRLPPPVLIPRNAPY
jgi:hypothetical protein